MSSPVYLALLASAGLLAAAAVVFTSLLASAVLFVIGVVVVEVPLLVWMRARRLFTLSAFAGATWQWGTDTAAMTLVTPGWTSVAAYSALRCPRRRCGVVAIRVTATNALIVIPQELIPAGAYAALHSRLERR